MKSTFFRRSLGPLRFLLLSMFAVPLLVALFARSARAGSLAYVVSVGANGPQFGTVDLANGKFRLIANTPEALSNLVWWNGSLLSLSTSDPFPGYLVKINPATGEVSAIGPTGLGFNAFDLAEVGGKLYLTDFSNNIYSVDPHTGAATLIAATGMPIDPPQAPPFTTNLDGTFNLCDESIYGVNGKLYASFDHFNVDQTTLIIDEHPADPTVSPALWQIDPSTGAATLVGPTNLNLGASVESDGKLYGFKLVITGFPGGFPASYSELVTLDLTTGNVTFVRVVDVNAGTVLGAAVFPVS